MSSKSSLSAVGLVVALAALTVPTLSFATSSGSGPLKAPPTTIPLFAYVKSIAKVGGAYQVTVDPAFFLTGLPAQKAAAADGQPSDSDYYIRDPEHSTLVFKLAANAAATVVTAAGGQVRSTTVTVAELAQIVAGKSPAKLHLMTGPLGYWITVKNGDTVVSLDQQYVQ